jgi:multiple sugar transport system permease protein
MMIPYITPPAVVGLLFAYMFDGNFGVVNDLLVSAGSSTSSIVAERSHRKFRRHRAAMVWYGTSHGAHPAGVAADDPADALRRRPGGRRERVAAVPLHHAAAPLPSILFLVLLRVIWMSNHIDMIFVLTQGGRGFANYTAAVYSFKLTNQFEIGYASALPSC